MSKIITPIVAIVSLTFLLAAGDPEKADLAKLQGDWQMVSGTRDGMVMPEAMTKTGKRVCKDHSTTVTVNGALLMTADFTVDASKNPKQIDYDVKAGANEGKKQLGIYKIDDDGKTVTFCFAAPDKDRPDAFESKAGDGRTFSIWKKSEEQGH